MEAHVREEIIKQLPKLRRFAFGLVGNRQDADDLVQAACEKALMRFHQWKPGTRLDSWMYKIIQNTWIDEKRRFNIRGNSVTTEELDNIIDNNAHRVREVQDSLEEVISALEDLSDEQRTVLLLVSVEGHSYQEAAEILGIPIGTVMSRLARARLSLYEAINKGTV